MHRYFIINKRIVQNKGMNVKAMQQVKGNTKTLKKRREIEYW